MFFIYKITVAAVGRGKLCKTANNPVMQGIFPPQCVCKAGEKRRGFQQARPGRLRRRRVRHPICARAGENFPPFARKRPLVGRARALPSRPGDGFSRPLRIFSAPFAHLFRRLRTGIFPRCGVPAVPIRPAFARRGIMPLAWVPPCGWMPPRGRGTAPQMGWFSGWRRTA